MDLASLKRELADPRFAGLDDEAAAALFNGANIAIARPIPAYEVRRLLHLRGKWAALRQASTVRGSAADLLLDALDTFDAFTLTDPAIAAVVGDCLRAVVDAGLLTNDDTIAITALGETKTSRAAQLGWTDIHGGDVASARAVDDDGQFPDVSVRLVAADARDAAWVAALAEAASKSLTIKYGDWLPGYEAGLAGGK